MTMERLLLHHCCAPCSVRVVPILSSEFQIESFWYNPNIHPQEEFEARKRSLEELAASSGLKLHFGPEETMERWVEQFSAFGLDRCRSCYALRLNATAERAKKLGIEYFSTTLLASPYQKHELIKELGMEIAAREDLTFVYCDFRPHYFEGKNEARQRGYYMQKYCGCIFSRQEREKEKQLKGQAK